MGVFNMAEVAVRGAAGRVAVGKVMFSHSPSSVFALRPPSAPASCQI